MPDSREIYSSQTRQTRTALGLSTVTLLIFSTIAKPIEGAVKLPPGYLEIEPIWLWPILAGTVTYFLISFVTAALYDKSDGITLDSLKSLEELKGDFAYARAAIDHSLDIAFQEIKHHWDVQKDGIETIPDSDMSRLQARFASHSDETQILQRLKNVKRRIGEEQEIEAAIENSKNKIASAKAQLSTILESMDAKYRKLRKKVESIDRFKNHWLEFIAPSAFAGLVLVYAIYAFFQSLGS